MSRPRREYLRGRGLDYRLLVVVLDDRHRRLWTLAVTVDKVTKLLLEPLVTLHIAEPSAVTHVPPPGGGS
ncbi:MAG: hypothetical protein ACJ77Z_04365 [Thermoleophilaceae bacterium]